MRRPTPAFSSQSLSRSFSRLLAGLVFCLVPGLTAALAPTARAGETVSTVLSFPTSIQGVQAGVIPGGDGFLYGTAYTTQSVYKVRPDGTGFQILHTFSQTDGHGFNSDGYYPARELVAPGDGFLYGLTTNGGANGNGTVYRISTAGAFQVLYTFSAEDNNFDNPDGAAPQSGLAVNGDGYLYGTAHGGGPNGEGTIFRVRADGTGFQTIHAFSFFGSATAGDNVFAPLTWGGDGYFYGTTKSGGANGFGSVYRLKPDGTGFAILHSFTSGEGGSFTAVTLNTDGRLYGVSFQGGANLAGLLWGLNPDGSGFTAVHVFAGQNSQNYFPDGHGPYGALAAGADGTLYGTTETGGVGGFGVVFKVSPSGAGFTVLAEWGMNTNDPNDPVGSLTRIGTGIYGTTSFGGRIGFGTVFKVSGVSGAVAAHAHVLWTNTNGQASLWNYDAVAGTETNHEYGPFSGWSAKAIADGSDAKTRVLWTNTNGQASLWSLDNTTGVYTNREFGPFAGYQAVGLSVGSDNTTHVLWTSTDGTASLWNYNAVSGTYSYLNYGPFPGWSAKSVADGPDGKTRILWSTSTGQVSLWSLNTATGAYVNHEYGPFSGYQTVGVSVGSDNTTHLLWSNTGGTASVWNNDALAGSYGYLNYGPFNGWSSHALVDGPDGKARVLWSTPAGQVSLWSLDNTTGVYTNHEFGPFAGWTAVGLSAGP